MLIVFRWRWRSTKKSKAENMQTKQKEWPLRSYYTLLSVQKSQILVGWPKQNTQIKERCIFFMLALSAFFFYSFVQKTKCIWPFFNKQIKSKKSASNHLQLVNRHLCIERSWTIGDESHVTTPSITHIEHRFGNDKYSSNISLGSGIVF